MKEIEVDDCTFEEFLALVEHRSLEERLHDHHSCFLACNDAIRRYARAEARQTAWIFALAGMTLVAVSLAALLWVMSVTQ